jgi:hypothetical protein
VGSPVLERPVADRSAKLLALEAERLGDRALVEPVDKRIFPPTDRWASRSRSSSSPRFARLESAILLTDP